MKTIGERIKYARESLLKVSQHELAKMLGIAQPSLHLIETGKTAQPRNIDKICNVLGVNRNWLLVGDYDEKKILAHDLSLLQKSRIKIPVLSWAQAKNFKEELGRIVMDNKTVFIDAGEYVGKDLFALIIAGDSMTAPYGDTFPDGSLIIIDPHVRPDSGEYVLAMIEGEAEAIFKKYVKDAGKAYLMSLNDRYPSIEVTDCVEIIGVAVESRKNLRKRKV